MVNLNDPPKKEKGLWNAVISVWSWFAILSCSFLCCCIQTVLALLTWPFDRRRKVTGRTFRLVGGVLASMCCPYWNFGVYGKPIRKLPRKSVVVSNHESQADPFLISRLPWEMKWLGKDSIFKIPVVGWCMWLAGDIPLKRGNPNSVKDAMAVCRDKIESGMPVMMFPEGTRSEGADMLPFKPGAFRLAIETGADVVPVAVSGTRRALPKHSWRLGKTRALVAAGNPISTQGMTLDDVPRLALLAHEKVRELRSELERVLQGVELGSRV